MSVWVWEGEGVRVWVQRLIVGLKLSRGCFSVCVWLVDVCACVYGKGGGGVKSAVT